MSYLFCCSGGCWRSTMTRTIQSPSCCLISASRAAGPSSPSFCSNILKYRQDSCKHLIFLCGLRGVLRFSDDINNVSVSMFVGEAQWRRCMFIKPQNLCSCCPLLSFVNFSSYIHVKAGFRKNFHNHRRLLERLLESQAATWKPEQASWRGLLEGFLKSSNCF